jgi:putative hemolysin
MSVVGKVRHDIIFPVNDLLMNLPNLKQLFSPINKHGSNKENIKIIEDIFASEMFVLYFPAGLVSRKQKRSIIDLDWKKSVISWAKKYERDIIPVHIDGRNTNFFYNLARLRKKIGIKANIEMLFLPDEMFKQKNKTLSFTIGEPISYQNFDNTHTNVEWAQILKEKVYALNKQ